MTKYEDLGRAFDAWRKDYFDDMFRSSRFARWFTAAFAEYIGAPEEFTDNSEDQPKPIKYVRAMKCIPNEEEDGFKLEDSKSTFNFLHMSDNGFWQFGLALVLEISPTVYPKQTFTALVSFALRSDDVIIYIFDGSKGTHSCIIDDKASFHVAFEQIISFLFSHLTKKQADRVTDVGAEDPAPEPMGFVSFPLTPSGPPPSTISESPSDERPPET